jgi:cell division protease FtsH
MDTIVELLVEKETLSGEEFRSILNEFTEIPAQNRVPPQKGSLVSA